MDTTKTEKHVTLNTILTIMFFILFFLALGMSYYKYYYTANYKYLIELPCNPETSDCQYRDCDTNPDECPPNGLSYYNKYSIKAYDFKKCENENCEEQCLTGKISCKLVTTAE